MSSRPTFNRGKIADYLDDPNKPLVNRVTLPYSMGSVFKIIDTAAWLENRGTDLVNRGTDPPVDFCSGKIEIAGRTVLCSNTEGHKYINLDRAFTSSCNPFFVRMCINLGYDKVLKMASLLGLGKKTGIEKQGIYESAGSLPSHSEIYNEGDVANLVLGQGKVSATPLQVVSIINSVVNDGIYKKPWILSEVLDSEGKVLSKFSKELDYRVFSEETAKRLRHLMIETVENGTGHLVNVEGGAGGKTGGAESGSGKATHAWFAGFFPAKEPKYSAVVLVENGGHGGQIAGPIFAQVAKKAIKAKHLKVE
jgi:penicillin-binding protein 2